MSRPPRGARWRAALVVLGAATAGVPVHAQTLSECARLNDDDARLACYDRVAGRPRTPQEDAVMPPPDRAARFRGAAPEAGDVVRESDPTAGSGSALALKWELEDDVRYGVLRLRTHQPNYVLPSRWSSDPNTTPTSPTLGTIGPLPLHDAETKYQFSFKTKLVQGLMGDRVDLWGAYTQQSSWQVYADSAPFRESNYEPELIATVRLPVTFGPVRLRMVNLGLVHQSNGRSLQLSRSWNRVYAQFGAEIGDFTLLVRPWWRIPEDRANDDNPDITRFVGRGDAWLLWRGGGHSLGLMVRNNLSTTTNRGAVQLDWRFPLYRNFKGYVQLFSGYGETMIDYNHRQDTVGIGFSLSDWL
ncbi:MAG: phospholipase A [Burkholderiales bacterium]|nr:phospholipase A [Burkholderiales bacterium]